MLFFFSSRRRHTRSLCDWSSDVCSSDLFPRHFRTVFLSRDQGHGQLRPIEFLARIQAELPANLPTSLWLKSQSLHRGIADFDRITQAQHLYRWLTALKCDDD